jgi:hypothetical protein
MSLENDDFISKTHTNHHLGILGTHGKINKNIIIDDILIPAINEFNIILTHISIPFEGESSIYIEDYFERQKDAPHIIRYSLDWKKNGPSSRNIRDSHIINNSSYFIIFLGKKSDYYTKMAEKLIKKGKNVITVDYIDYQLTLLEPYIKETQNKKKKTKEKSIMEYFNN